MPPDFVDAIGRFQYVNDEKGKNRRVATRLRRKAKGKRQKAKISIRLFRKTSCSKNKKLKPCFAESQSRRREEFLFASKFPRADAQVKKFNLSAYRIRLHQEFLNTP
jgi:hypothetical protein